MPSYVTPGLYFEVVDNARQDINPSRVDIPAFIGVASQGPLHQPVQINSQAQFQAIFGGFIPNSYLAYTVKAFFENGGTRCYVVRVASNTAAPAWVELQDEAGLATLRITASSPGSWGNDLALFLTRSNTFATQTLPGVQQPGDRSLLFVESVVGFSRGTLVRLFQQQAAAPARAPDRAPARDAPTIHEGDDEQFTRGMVGASLAPIITYGIVLDSFPEQNLLKWDAPLDASYDLSKTISLETVEFSLSVYLAGQLREIFSGLSLIDVVGNDTDKHNPSYVENAITEQTSQFLRVENLHSPTPLSSRLPDANAKNIVRGSVPLQNGRDGLADLSLEDLTGDPTAEIKRGLRTLEDVREVAVIAMPDLTLQPVPVPQTAPPPVPLVNQCLPGAGPLPVAKPAVARTVEQMPGFSLDQVFRVQQAMVEYCEQQQRCIALLDPPVQPGGGRNELGPYGVMAGAPTVLTVAEIQSWRRRFDSKYAALYYPQVLVYDPLKLGGQVVRAIPPCGHIAGIFARVDSQVGVHRAPANEELSWAQAVNVDITGAVQGVLNPLGINCIRTFPGRGVRIYGARTVSSEPSWIYVNVRRFLIMIERSVEVATQWAAFEPNDFGLRQTLVLTISTFLETLFLQGALAGSTPSEAFFVKCNDSNNPPEITDAGELIVEVGVAPSIPAEFVVFRLGRTQDELEITELT
jgi:uncharacterized protein